MQWVWYQFLEALVFKAACVCLGVQHKYQIVYTYMLVCLSYLFSEGTCDTKMSLSIFVSTHTAPLWTQLKHNIHSALFTERQ